MQTPDKQWKFGTPISKMLPSSPVAEHPPRVPPRESIYEGVIYLLKSPKNEGHLHLQTVNGSFNLGVKE